MTTVLLHGFWGQPQDWNPVLQRLSLGVSVWTPNFYEPGSMAPHHSLDEWVNHFVEEVTNRFGHEPVQLVGYSMGGRLALAVLKKHPNFFKRALILSAHPGLKADEVSAREHWESEWLEKFASLSWDELNEQWQEQSVLQSSQPLPRRYGDGVFREMLRQSLAHWSPRFQTWDEKFLQSLPGAVDWAFGALDQKYANLAKTLQNVPVQGQISVIPNAGHRLIGEATSFVVDWIEKGE